MIRELCAPDTAGFTLARITADRAGRTDLGNALGHVVGFWGCSVHGQQLDSVILVGPIPLRIFCDSTILLAAPPFPRPSRCSRPTEPRSPPLHRQRPHPGAPRSQGIPVCQAPGDRESPAPMAPRPRGSPRPPSPAQTQGHAAGEPLEGLLVVGGPSGPLPVPGGWRGSCSSRGAQWYLRARA